MLEQYLRPDDLAHSVGHMMDDFHSTNTPKEKRDLGNAISLCVTQLVVTVGQDEAWEMILRSEEFPAHEKHFWKGYVLSVAGDGFTTLDPLKADIYQVINNGLSDKDKIQEIEKLIED